MNKTEANDTHALLSVLTGRRNIPAATLAEVASRLADRSYRALAAGITPADIPADLPNPHDQIGTLRAELAEARLELNGLRMAAVARGVDDRLRAALAAPSDELIRAVAQAWRDSKKDLDPRDVSPDGAFFDVAAQVLRPGLPAILAYVDGGGRNA